MREAIVAAIHATGFIEKDDKGNLNSYREARLPGSRMVGTT